MLDILADTAIAGLAVLVILGATCSAYAALITMKVILRRIVIIQVAEWTEVRCKPRLALLTRFTHVLSKLALGTLDGRDLEPIERMRQLRVYDARVHDLVVAEPTVEEAFLWHEVLALGVRALLECL